MPLGVPYRAGSEGIRPDYSPRGNAIEHVYTRACSGHDGPKNARGTLTNPVQQSHHIINH